jgi:trimeric autotransporter adhesin
MKHPWIAAVVLTAFVLTSAAFAEEQINTAAGETTVPRLIKFSGALKDALGSPRMGQVMMNFALYASREGGESLWRESQLVKLDEEGRYTIFLGTSEKEGLPLQLFSAEKAQWLGVQPEGEAEQARAVLVAVPYALKAADADSVGGEPISSFVLNSDWVQAGGDFNTYKAILQQRGIISADGILVAKSGTSLPKLSSQRAGGMVIANGLEGATNTFYGTNAGTNISSGVNNSFFGQNAGYSNTTGYSNSFFGSGTGSSNTTAYQNSFFGMEAGMYNTEGGFNSFFGAYAGRANTTGTYNSFFGRGAGRINTTGASNSFFGNGVGFNNTTGDSNSFFGDHSGFSNTTGYNNAFFGMYTGYYNTIGISNSFFGTSAGYQNTEGISNSFFGVMAGYSNTAGNYNSFFGSGAGYSNTTGKNNSFFGDGSGRYNTAGGFNSFFGVNAGIFNTTGNDNSFFGNSAGISNTTGGDNVFFGSSAGFSNTTGGYNSFFGVLAGSSNTTGGSNSFFGTGAGSSNTVESRNSFIGSGSDGAAGITNATALGYQAKVTQSNSLVLGSINGINSATADTKVGIGTTAPQAKLHVEGNAYFNGNVSFGTVNSYATLTFQNDSTVNDPIAMIDTAPGGRTWRFGGGVGGAGLFTIRDDTAGANRFSIRSDGNIGIGTTNAYAKLTFAYDSTVSDPIAMIDTAPGGRSWRFGGGVGGAGLFTIRDDTAGANRLTIASDGNVGIGTTNPTEKLQVVGNIKVSGTILYGLSSDAEEIPDYVFEPGYELMPVQELERYLSSEKHLPSVPSAAEIKQNGLNLSEFQMKLLKKIEELTLYIVQQAKAINQKKSEIASLNAQQQTAIEKKDSEIASVNARLIAIERTLERLTMQTTENREGR